MTVITEFAAAKVNLTLEVLGKRPDGYHDIASLVAFADVGDIVTLDTSKPRSVVTTGPFGGSIAGENLIELTLTKLAQAAPGLQLGAITLQKNLPIAAGIGGGSADAAAVMRAVRRANHDCAQEIDWLKLAASLGADVPVCFGNSAAWMTGVGDQIRLIASLPWLTAVLVNPLAAMPADKTAQVFRALAAPQPRFPKADPPPPPGPFPNAHMLVDYIAAHGNGLDAAARRVAPVIADVLRALESTPGCQYAAMSGGGPTCFAFFADHDAAAAAIKHSNPAWWVQPVKLH